MTTTFNITNLSQSQKRNEQILEVREKTRTLKLDIRKTEKARFDGYISNLLQILQYCILCINPPRGLISFSGPFEGGGGAYLLGAYLFFW